MQTMTPIRVLCVDDQESVCEAVCRVLRPPRFRVVGMATRIDDVEGLIARARPDVLVLDVDMPGGEEPLHWLARFALRWPRMRVVMHSAHLTAELIDRAVEAGAWGYLSKHDDPAAIPDLLERVVQGGFALSESARYY